MCLDPIVISAIIGVFGVVVAFTEYVLQNLYTARREREAREYQIKRKRYEELIRTIASGIHIVQTKKEKTTFEYKEEFDKLTNSLWLFASDDVLRRLKAYIFPEKKDEIIQNAHDLILAMRKDLKIKTDLKPSEIIWFRAT